MPSLRRIGLAVALVATIVASVLDFQTPEAAAPEGVRDVPAPVSRAPAATRADAVKPLVLAAGFSRVPFAPQAADLFAAHSWQPPAAPAPKAAPAPPPSAPALPFHYVGKVLDQGQVLAFVGQGARTYLLRPGDIVADYRVIEITPTEMRFMYLPLNQPQRLAFGSAN